MESWLRSFLNDTQYNEVEDLFKAQDILELEDVAALTDEQLLTAIGVKKLGIRNRILRAIEDLEWVTG